MILVNRTLQTRDHMMIGMTSCMLFICYKMMVMSPLLAGMLIWFNMNLFNAYCRWRRSENM